MADAYTVALPEARAALLAELDAFMAAVASLDDHALLGASRAYGWSRLDCVVHVRMGLQELLAGIPATTDSAPEVDAASYWSAWEDAADQDSVPGILITRRTASAYNRPRDALEHLHQVAAGLKQITPAMPDTPVFFQGHSISAGDLLATWAVEVAVHHHDLDAPDSAVDISPSAVTIGRRTVEALREDLAGTSDDLHVMLTGFGRA